MFSEQFDDGISLIESCYEATQTESLDSFCDGDLLGIQDWGPASCCSGGLTACSPAARSPEFKRNGHCAASNAFMPDHPFQATCIKLYQPFPGDVSFEAAEVICSSRSTNLVTTIARLETIRPGEEVWVGARERDEERGKFQFADGNELPIDHPAWAQGEPMQSAGGSVRCVRYAGGRGLLARPCEEALSPPLYGHQRGIICEDGKVVEVECPHHWSEEEGWSQWDNGGQHDPTMPGGSMPQCMINYHDTKLFDMADEERKCTVAGGKWTSVSCGEAVWDCLRWSDKEGKMIGCYEYSQNPEKLDAFCSGDIFNQMHGMEAEHLRETWGPASCCSGGLTACQLRFLDADVSGGSASGFFCCGEL